MKYYLHMAGVFFAGLVAGLHLIQLVPPNQDEWVAEWWKLGAACLIGCIFAVIAKHR